MRRLVQVLLVAFAFAVPWEFALELRDPLGPVARFVGILLLLVAVPAVLRAGRLRAPGPVQWVTLALLVWFCCTFFWSIDPETTLGKLRAYLQEMMAVWLLWEFAEEPRDLRRVLRAYVAGSWVLAILTFANFASPEAIATGQIRFVAEGLDPNDTARFLDLAFPFAAVLADGESNWAGRILALGYFPLGILAVLLTASRGGFLAALLALGGSAILLARAHPRRMLTGALALPALGFAAWSVVPRDTLERLTTISEQLNGGDLNDRVNIWAQGWHAFVQAPLAGTGAGSFVAAAGLAPIDTAHNTALSIAVSGGLCALCLAAAVIAVVVRALLGIRGPLFLALGTALLVWAATSLTAAIEEDRATWLLFAMIAVAARMANDQPAGPDACSLPQATRLICEVASEPLL